MTMLHTMQTQYTKMRPTDVTTDDISIDGSTSGYRLTDITERDVIEYDPAANGIEIIFSAEGANGDTFGAYIWNIAQGGIAERVAEITCALGTAWADMTNADSTTRLFADTVTISTEYHLKEVTVADSGNTLN